MMELQVPPLRLMVSAHGVRRGRRDGIGSRFCRIDARTEPDNRRNGPCRQIDDRPKVPPLTASKREQERYDNDLDAWMDTWPDWRAYES